MKSNDRFTWIKSTDLFYDVIAKYDYYVHYDKNYIL